MASKNRGGRKRDNKKTKSTSNIKSSPPKIKPKKDKNQSLWSMSTHGPSDGEWIKDDIANIIHWFRQALSLFIGIIWGYMHLTGIIGIITYFLITISVMYFYKTNLNVPDDIFDLFDIMKEGIVPGFGTFMLGWICTYSVVHF